MNYQIKIVALDDDPTGSQTVHSCLLLTKWDKQTLRDGLLDSSPIFFVLTNTRSMNPVDASTVTRAVCRNLSAAIREIEAEGSPVNPIIVSRSDSTLRGHYPIETDVIAEVLGPFDAHFIVPAFFEGGRITINSTHYVMQNGKAVPAHETEYARDSIFGYQNSYLPKYIEEKTDGRILSRDVERFVLTDIRGDIRSRLSSLADNVPCVVDAETQEDLDGFARQLLEVAESGRRFLFRSAASIVTSLAGLPPQPIAAEAMGSYVPSRRGGVFLIGSHVHKTSAQLRRLLRLPDVTGIEVDVATADFSGATLSRLSAEVHRAHERGETPAIYTSREERRFDSPAARIDFGKQVSKFLMDIVRELPTTIGYLVSKGGITSNDVLSDGLELTASRVAGQILPGCSVILCPEDHPQYPNLPVVIFPGNVGDEESLVRVKTRLQISAFL